MDSKTRHLRCMQWIEQRINENHVRVNCGNLRKEIISLVSTELAKKHNLSFDQLEHDLEGIIPEISKKIFFTKTEKAVAQALKDCLDGKKPFQSKRGAKVITNVAFALTYAVARTNNLYATGKLFNKDNSVMKRSIANLGKSLGVNNKRVDIIRQASPIDSTQIDDWTLQPITTQKDFYCETIRMFRSDRKWLKLAEIHFCEFIEEQSITETHEQWVEQNIRGS